MTEACELFGPLILCSKTRTDGQPCNAPARKGTVPPICNRHGGQLPGVKRKAQERILEAMDPGIARLHRIVSSDTSTDRDAIQAMRLLAQMAGLLKSDTPEAEVGVVEIAFPDKHW